VAGEDPLKGIDDPTDAVRAMRELWALGDALRGGTRMMRAARTRYLPQEPNESDAAYASRLARSFLFAAYGDTVLHLAAKPFSRTVKLGEDAPETSMAWSDDVDLEGTTLTAFARAVFEDAVDHGITHALVDFPQTGGALSLAEERELGVRPFFVHVPAMAILGWRTTRHLGREILTQLRILETASVPSGAFGEETRQRIRVYERSLPGERRTNAGRRIARDQGSTVYRVYEKGADGKWMQIAEGGVSLNEIPLATLYTRKSGFMTACPPLEDLAWKNLEHWQSASDQRHILHVARVPLLFGAGIEAKDLTQEDGTPVTIGPNRMLTATSPQASLTFVEHGGAAIGAGREDLLDLLDQMAALGMAPMVERSGDVTATEKAIDQAESVSDLKSWTRALEGFLEHLFSLGARWIGSDTETTVDVYDDFSAALRGAQDLSELREARKAGDISRATYLRELVRRGALAESFDAEADAEAREIEKAEEPEPVMPEPPIDDPMRTDPAE
jgi:hypothetical protein